MRELPDDIEPSDMTITKSPYTDYYRVRIFGAPKSEEVPDFQDFYIHRQYIEGLGWSLYTGDVD